ncbi:MAG: helix-turn-helix transcriptional regulator [Clostridia bacterium]|nr:helix-turn-helix transcriptional regulator [Clostridia bacterium]
MNIQENVSNNLKKYRKEMGLSQEALAERLGLSSQAVSKWECMQSIPDIDAIVALSELFGITIDKLLLDRDPEVIYREAEGASARVSVFDKLPDDGVLRVLQFKGKRLLQQDEMDPEVYIPLRIDHTAQNVINVIIDGNAHFEGEVCGNISCGNIVGVLRCEGNISGGNIGEIRACEGDISCGNVGHIDSCEGDISCGNVETVEMCEGDMDCRDVQSINVCEGDISCGAVGQIVSCEGDIDCGDVDVISNCEGDIDCGSVDVINNCEGDIYT